MSGLRSRWAAFAGSFVAVALGVGLLVTMGLGLASTFDAPERAPRRFAASPVVVIGTDTLTVGRVSHRLFHPHPVDARLLTELRALGPVATDGRPDAVGVDADPAAVHRVVGDRGRVLTGDERRQADPEPERDAEALVTVNALLGTAGGVTAFVSVFVVASTFAFAVALRRREFGLLRTAGATPGQVRRALLTEAALVGVAASAAGCALGAWGAPELARVLVEGGIAPEWFTIRDAAWPFHVAFWTGLAVAVTGAWAAARRAGRTGPAEALREADVDSGVLPLGRRLLGAALLVMGAALLAWTLLSDPSELLKRKTYTTQPMVLITAVALLAPLLVRPVARALPLPGATGMLVRENATAALRRTAAVAAPVLVTVALAGSLLGSAGTVTASKAAEARQQTAADHVVTGRNLQPIPVPGATLSPTASTGVFVRDGESAVVRYEARAVTDPAAFAVLARLPVVTGDIRNLDDGSIVINQEIANSESGNRAVGDRINVWLGDGRQVSLRIAAVLATGTGDNGPYVTTANARAAAVDRIDVRLPPGTGPAVLRATGGTVTTTDAWAAPRTSPQTRLGLLVVLGIALVYTAISLASTLSMATSVRGGELRSLRLTGATRPQVLAVVAGETLLAVAVGAVLGAAVAAVGLAGLGAALASLSAPATITVPWGTLGAALGGCAVVAVASALLGAARTGR
ncbi:FtsX-like permease family protein [Streptomyces sp. CB03238]|uniref:ABC transporter permease n=1 Tax=Streptomyces sp. CB03238 TaxID=1907777 RepID=UPI000A110270|nr:FtsX-like permease family protein [Streptomyces sp. CB03238]ORT59466.1 ABC transporter permease [Streptomyces sp. CB03238]